MASPRLEPGARYGDFQLCELLGGGGLGTVYRARSTDGQQHVALKLPRTDAPSARWQLRREAAVLERLRTLDLANVVRWIGGEPSSANPWMAIELVEGCTLAELIAAFHGPVSGEPARQETWTSAPAEDPPHVFEPPLPPIENPGVERPGAERVLAVLGSLASSLANLHDAGIVHGDLSARNVLVRAGGEPVLIDFGSAIETFEALPSREVLIPRAVSRGTPGYAAPEQYLGRPVDHRSDLYALGALVHQALVGVPPSPFASRRRSPIAPSILAALAHGEAQELEQELARLLEPEPYHRSSSAWPLATLLCRSSGKPPPSHRTPRQREWRRAALVGRSEVMRVLANARADAAAGRGGTIVLSGGTGLGKTRLLNESLYAAAAAGFQTFAERGVDPERSLPSALPPPASLRFASWLDYVNEVAESAGPHQPALRVAAEQLAERLAAQAKAGADVSPELERARLFDALLETLVQVSSYKPLAIALDDLHWADPLTLAFLASERARQLGQLPVLVVGAADPFEASLEAATALEAIPALHINLNPLASAEVREMICSMHGDTHVSEGLVEAAQRYAAGAPLLVSEYVRDWRQAGADDPDEPLLLEAAAPISGDMQVPQALRSLFERRLGGVVGNARQVLTIAAVLGTEFDEAELAQLSEVGARLAPHEVTLALEQLRRLGVLVQSNRVRTAFVIGGMRHYCLRLHDQAARGPLLRRVAAACDELGIDPARSGYIWAEAGDPERAYPRLVHAAQRAMQHHAVGAARQLYAQAACEAEKLAAAPELSLAPPREVYERLADLLLKSARHEEALRWYEQALRLVPASHPARVTLLRKSGDAWSAARGYERAFHAFRNAEAANPALRDEDGSEWLEVQQGLFWLSYYGGPTWRHLDPTPLIRRIESIEPVVDAAGSTAQRIAFHQCVAACLMAESRFSPSPAAVHHARQALAHVSSEARFAAQEPAALFYLAFPLSWAGAAELAEAERLFEQAVERAAWFEDITTLARAQLYLTVARRRLGSPERVLRSVAAARRLAERVRSSAYMGAAFACEAWAHWRLGQESAALRLAEQAHGAWSQGKLRYPFQWLGSLVLAELYRLGERFDEARELLIVLLDADLAELPEPLRIAIAEVRDTEPHAWNVTLRDQAHERVTRAACALGYL
jgi:serine/threonine protein kinase